MTRLRVVAGASYRFERVSRSMSKPRRLASRLALVATVVATMIAAGLVGIGSAAAATPDVAHRIKVHSDIIRVAKDSSAVHFSCQDSPIDGSAGPRCYQPSQIQAAYGLSPLLKRGINGSGRTIVIVDAYGNPYITTDLSQFDSTFGLPAPNFSQIAPFGVPTFDINDPNMAGWAEEITLDVLWAHAVAPGARIVLALAASNNDTDIYNTTKYVIDHNLGDVISQSFGEAEACMDPQLLVKQHKLFEQAQRQQMTVFASSGDSGASQGSCDGSSAILAASTPASDPLVTGVGGTTLNADATTGAYIGETAWTEQLFGCNPPALDPADINCSGGGFSTVYSRPSFQSTTQSKKLGRGVPDVSYNAGINGGVLTHCGVCNVLSGGQPSDPSFFLFGGTSAGSPQWAGMVAVGDQLAHRRFGDINPALYTISRSHALYRASLHDVTVGNNDVAEIGTGFNAAKGWDPVTGLGTPNASALLPLLAVAAIIR